MSIVTWRQGPPTGLGKRRLVFSRHNLVELLHGDRPSGKKKLLSSTSSLPLRSYRLFQWCAASAARRGHSGCLIPSLSLSVAAHCAFDETRCRLLGEGKQGGKIRTNRTIGRSWAYLQGRVASDDKLRVGPPFNWLARLAMSHETYIRRRRYCKPFGKTGTRRSRTTDTNLRFAINNRGVVVHKS